MAAQGKPPGFSRWGSFLNVVESKLDTILADAEDTPGDKNAAAATPDKKQTGAANGKGTENGLSRTGSSASRTNDRLQERLAKAVAQKNAAQKANGSNVPSRTASPSRSVATSSPRQSLDSRPARASLDLMDASEKKNDTQATNIEEEGSNAVQNPANETLIRTSVDSNNSHIPRQSQSTDSTRPTLAEEVESPQMSTEKSPRPSGDSFRTPAEYESQLQQLRQDFETTESQRQDEIHEYKERIDSLQDKLQYLTKRVSETARNVLSEAPAGSLEKKLAEKEEMIIQLMEEGQKLSKTEMKNMSTIKKLYGQIADSKKEVEEAKKKSERAENEISKLTDRARKSELAERNLNERLKSMAKLQKDFEAIRVERDSKDSQIAALKAQLHQSQIQAEKAKEQINTEALAIEKQRVSELEEQLSTLKIEKELAADRSQARIKELQEQHRQDSERARVTEMELKAEQQMLESKLEVMRARAEEVSSGATGDAQAKSMRQMEMLQNQYATAIENWKVMEARLHSTIAGLEKERDDTVRRADDVRRKAREITTKSKRNEEELEETKAKLDTFQHDLTERQAALDKLQRRAEEAEKALRDANTSFEQEKLAWRAEKEQQAEDERNKSFTSSRAESPANLHLNGHKTPLTPELFSFSDQMRKPSLRSINSSHFNDILQTPERLASRRQSTQPTNLRNINSRHGNQSRQDSIQSIDNGDGRGYGESNIPDTPNIHTPSMVPENDDFADSVNGAAQNSPHQTINDMVSVSTIGAGPSVQLVERMSANVRKLESEKLAAQEEMTRLTAQRDEARREIAALMQEVECKRAADEKIKVLEGQVKELDEKFNTTLVAFGEKEERVGELEADIVDLKALIRDMVEERTTQ